MSNYENIRSYAEFSHTAAQHGGVNEYLNEIEDTYYDLGVSDEKRTEGLKILCGMVVTYGAVEGIRYIRKKIKNRQEERRKNAVKRAENAKEKIIQKVESSEFIEAKQDEEC